jgi:hypothetical protein
MSEAERKPAEIAALVRSHAELSLGPWPRDLQLFIFVLKSEWKCGLSPATQESDAEYRDGVLRIAKELQKTSLFAAR